MRWIQIVKRLFFKLSDFERVKSQVLQCYESSRTERKGKNDNLVPVTFPVKEAFPHKQISLKPLLASLELWRDSKEIFVMPKGETASTVCGCSWPSSQWLLERFLFTDVRDCTCVGIPAKDWFAPYNFTRGEVSRSHFILIEQQPQNLKLYTPLP
jgi:hypothetical protein